MSDGHTRNMHPPLPMARLHVRYMPWTFCSHTHRLEIQKRIFVRVSEDDIPKNTLEIWAGSLNPLYVILSIPAQMSGIFKIHRDQGTVQEGRGDGEVVAKAKKPIYSENW